jgi:hypothetical protein
VEGANNSAIENRLAIVPAKDGGVLTIKWRDYPEQPQETPHRSSVALLNSRVALHL